jgi:hypothetical protein
MPRVMQHPIKNYDLEHKFVLLMVLICMDLDPYAIVPTDKIELRDYYKSLHRDSS